MSYYATGDGEIRFKRVLSQEEFDIACNIIENVFDFEGLIDPDEVSGVKPHQTCFSVWSNEEYYEDAVIKTLNELSDIATIEYGVVHFSRFSGQELEIWRFVNKDGKWLEENGSVVYYDPKNVHNRMSHAFYSVLGCLADNMPDCDDEYSEECRQIYDDALAEFREAEKALKEEV